MWILDNGLWLDAGVWDDSDFWQDYPVTAVSGILAAIETPDSASISGHVTSTRSPYPAVLDYQWVGKLQRARPKKWR